MTAPARLQAPPKRRRGREDVRDMVLSMGLMMAIVVVYFFLGRPDRDAEQAIRVIDPTTEVRALQAAVPGVPVPTGLPSGWRPTSATPEGGGLRIGYVTPQGEYAEYAARGSAPGTFVPDQTGKGRQGGSLRVGQRTFQVWSDDTGHTSLVLPSAASTVVVGGLRETASDEELQQLAASLR